MELFIPEMKNIEKMRLFDMGLYRDGAYNLNIFQWDEFDGADYGEEFQARFQIEAYYMPHIRFFEVPAQLLNSNERKQILGQIFGRSLSNYIARLVL